MNTPEGEGLENKAAMVATTSIEGDEEAPSNQLKGREAATLENSEQSQMQTMTQVEQIAERIETRRANRVPITFHARVRFLRDCRQIATDAGDRFGRISVAALHEYRDRVAAECEQGVGWDNIGILKALGFLCDVDCLLAIIDRAIEVTEANGYHWLYYSDFNFDHTTNVSRFPLFRSQLYVALAVVFLYYLFTPILFCNMMAESNICGGIDEDPYVGWVSALYFASTTMSTVGYGDLTVAQDPVWKSFIGSIYMLLSMVVAVVAFSAAASVTLNPFQRFFDRLFERFSERSDDDQFLYERINRIRIVKITELTAQILTFVAVGVFAARISAHFEDDPERQWNWMTSFYWAVQTTTTIGYGDLAQPFGLRYFKIVYLMLSTFLVGNAFGKLGSLREELVEARRQHAWSRRKITRRFIDEMQAYIHDDKVDEYEFLVSSLLLLGKVSSDDIRPIMEKFRTIAGSKGYIGLDESLSADESMGEDLIMEDALISHAI